MPRTADKKIGVRAGKAFFSHQVDCLVLIGSTILVALLLLPFPGTSAAASSFQTLETQYRERIKSQTLAEKEREAKLDQAQLALREYHRQLLIGTDASDLAVAKQRSLADINTNEMSDALNNNPLSDRFARGADSIGDPYWRRLRFEDRFDNPFRFNSIDTSSQLLETREQMAHELTNRTLRDSARMVLSGADPNALPIRILRFFSKLGDSGVTVSDHSKTKSADTATGRNVASQSPAGSGGTGLVADQPSVAEGFRVRTRLHAGHQKGTLRLETPLADAEVNVETRHRDAPVSLGVRQSLPSVGMESIFVYRPENKESIMDVRMKVTEEISWGMNSVRNPNTDGESQQAIRVDYRISF